MVITIELNKIKSKYNLYAIWKNENLFNLTEKIATNNNIRKGSFMAHLESQTGFKFSSCLYSILETINENQNSKTNTGLYRRMSWTNLFNTLNQEYNIKFKSGLNKVTTDEMSINDIVFLVEYSEWLLNKYKQCKSNDHDTFTGEGQLEWIFELEPDTAKMID